MRFEGLVRKDMGARHVACCHNCAGAWQQAFVPKPPSDPAELVQFYINRLEKSLRVAENQMELTASLGQPPAYVMIDQDVRTYIGVMGVNASRVLLPLLIW